MEKKQVPQDKSRTYGGHQKLLYAVDKDGNYDGVQSSGWEAEEQATYSAIDLLNQLRGDAWQRAKAGSASPLEYHMYHCRMDLALLSQTTGLFKWRIKRHFKPIHFSQLNNKIIDRYCEALGLTPDTLTTLPESL
jgi:hypothetical protein